MSEAVPISIAKTDARELKIEWSDGLVQQIGFRVLRDGCQCATCLDKKSKQESEKRTNALPVLSAAEARPLEILQMQPVGNYAYNIQFSDGHNTGIFTLEYLRSLST